MSRCGRLGAPETSLVLGEAFRAPRPQAATASEMQPQQQEGAGMGRRSPSLASGSSFPPGRRTGAPPQGLSHVHLGVEGGTCVLLSLVRSPLSPTAPWPSPTRRSLAAEHRLGEAGLPSGLGGREQPAAGSIWRCGQGVLLRTAHQASLPGRWKDLLKLLDHFVPCPYSTYHRIWPGRGLLPVWPSPSVLLGSHNGRPLSVPTHPCRPWA